MINQQKLTPQEEFLEMYGKTGIKKGLFMSRNIDDPLAPYRVNDTGDLYNASVTIPGIGKVVAPVQVAGDNLKFNGQYWSNTYGLCELFKTPLFTDANLVGYWRFEGNSNDSKGSNNGTDTEVTYGTAYGKFGQGAFFVVTSSSKIVVNNPTGLPAGNNEITITAWINPTKQQQASPCSIVAWGDDTANEMAGLGVDGTGLYWIGQANDTESDWSYPTGTWSFIAATYTPDTGTMTKVVTFYVNGVQQGVEKYLTNTPAVGNTFLNFSQQRPGAYVGFDGSIDDVAIFSRVLTPAEINILYLWPR